MAAWTPLSDTTLAAKVAAWLDFSDGATLTLDGASILAIADKKSSIAFTPPGPAPTLGSVDGKGAVSIAVGELVAVDAAIYPGGGAFVGVTHGDDEAVEFKEYMRAGHETRTLYINPRMARIWGYGNVAFDTLGAAAQANVFSIDVPVDGAINTSAVFQDGTQHFVSGGETNATRTMAALANAPVDLGIGGSDNIAGLLGECLWIAGNMTTDERQKLEGYLAHKWGTAALLPAEHPYKSAAPGSSAGPNLAASAGALSSAGQPAVFGRGLRLAAEAGAVAVAGRPALLRRDVRAAAQVGALSATGRAAALRVSADLRLPAGDGFIDIDGAPAGFRVSRRLSAQGGSVAADGRDAFHRAGRRVTAATEALAVAGGAAAFALARRLAAAGGSLAATGTPVGLARTEMIPATAVMPGVWRERSAAGTWLEHELRGTWRRA